MVLLTLLESFPVVFSVLYVVEDSREDMHIFVSTDAKVDEERSKLLLVDPVAMSYTVVVCCSGEWRSNPSDVDPIACPIG